LPLSVECVELSFVLFLDQRFEETRMHEQAEEFARQEKILKLISSELTRNTTRVVEQAVKAEVQQSVLPSLENITRAEVKAVLNDQVSNGMIEVINRVGHLFSQSMFVFRADSKVGFTWRDRENPPSSECFEPLRQSVDPGVDACYRATDQRDFELCFLAVPLPT